ncbi:MAG: InlB B-repeat-containing protein, partial [Lachnospiraceae bacterium]|nr:InlB B-repeat-containing protein [Lachnospiraceae bacterium]
MRNKKIARFMPTVLVAAVMMLILIPMGFKTVKAAPTGSGTETDPLVVDNFTDLKTALESNEDLYIVVDTFQTTSTSGYTGLYAPDDYAENGFAIQSNGKKVLTVTTTIDCRPLSVSTLYSFIRVNGTLEIKGTGTITCGFNGQRPNAVFYVMYPGVLIVNDGITIKGGYGMEPNYHGAAVYNYSGTVTIKGGTFWGNTGTVGESTATVSHLGGTTTIEGGSFNVNDEQNNPNFPSYGFYGNDDNIILSGGTYQGITAPSGKTIGDMLATGYETYTDSWAIANAESLNSYTGILRIAETPPTYNIHVNNGIATPASAKPGETVTLTADPIPTGYIFYKWDIVTGTFTLADEEATTTTFVMPAEDVAVSPLRTSEAVLTGYTVSFDPNGGSGTMDSVTDVPAGSYTLPSNGFTAPTSKEFDQWEVGGTRYNGGDTITINSNISVKALWKYVAPITEISVNGFESPVAGKKAGDYLNLTVPNGCHYYIDYERWYDTVTGPLSDEDLFESGRIYYCSMLIYTEGSYVFDDAPQFFINDSTVMVNSTESELISTYARLVTVYESPSVPATYAVTFDANGHGTAPATQTVEDGKTGTKPANPAETGWIFGGWYTEAACTSAFDFSTPITADIKLYAKWTEESVTPVSYTVTFDANGHGTAPAAQTVEDGKTGTKPADPAETGWIFGGWYTETACTNAFDFSNPITADIKLYAKWTEESVTP